MSHGSRAVSWALTAVGQHPGMKCEAGGATGSPCVCLLSLTQPHTNQGHDLSWGLRAGPQGAQGLSWQFLVGREAELAQRDPRPAPGGRGLGRGRRCAVLAAVQCQSPGGRPDVMDELRALQRARSAGPD